MKLEIYETKSTLSNNLKLQTKYKKKNYKKKPKINIVFAETGGSSENIDYYYHMSDLIISNMSDLIIVSNLSGRIEIEVAAE